MAFKLGNALVNVQAENEGEWQDSSEFPGVQYLLRSVHYPPYTIERDMELAKLGRKYGKQGPPDHVVKSLLGRLFAKHLLLDWRGFDDAPYTKTMVAELLPKRDARKIVEDISYCAGRVGQGEIDQIEEIAGNSPNASDGSSSPGAEASETSSND